MELRWVERVEPAPHLGPDIGQIVRVLQFRVRTGSEADRNGYVTGPIWSAWTDVPVVRDTQGKP